MRSRLSTTWRTRSFVMVCSGPQALFSRIQAVAWSRSRRLKPHGSLLVEKCRAHGRRCPRGRGGCGLRSDSSSVPLTGAQARKPNGSHHARPQKQDHCDGHETGERSQSAARGYDGARGTPANGARSWARSLAEA